MISQAIVVWKRPVPKGYSEVAALNWSEGALRREMVIALPDTDLEKLALLAIVDAVGDAVSRGLREGVRIGKIRAMRGVTPSL
jgi:hypothetical protein